MSRVNLEQIRMARKDERPPAKSKGTVMVRLRDEDQRKIDALLQSAQSHGKLVHIPRTAQERIEALIAYAQYLDREQGE